MQITCKELIPVAAVTEIYISYTYSDQVFIELLLPAKPACQISTLESF